MTSNKFYVAVSSWLLSFSEECIDECDHIFALPEGMEPEDVRVLVSDVLGTRFWSYMEGNDLTSDDFDSCIYDSAHDLTADFILKQN